MDVNAASPLVWDFYKNRLKKIKLWLYNTRLDAFAIAQTGR
jgi:hypothetical protein